LRVAFRQKLTQQRRRKGRKRKKLISMDWSMFPEREDFLTEDEYNDAVDDFYDSLESYAEEKRLSKMLEEYEAN
jgi:hypothetical protein